MAIMSHLILSILLVGQVSATVVHSSPQAQMKMHEKRMGDLTKKAAVISKKMIVKKEMNDYILVSKALKQADKMVQDAVLHRTKEDVSKKQMPALRLQVGNLELNKFMDSLSTECRRQFEQMLAAKGNISDIHMFGSEGKRTAADCAKFSGALCHTKASIREGSYAPDKDGRRMTSNMHIEGKGCWPKFCLGSDDLDKLSRFMHHKTLEAAGGMIEGSGGPSSSLPQIGVDVDCTQSGGSYASVAPNTRYEDWGRAHRAKSFSARQAKASFAFFSAFLSYLIM
eukprot:TRINITY_DN2643_c0_g3_i1.p1 TRINITY_DN2643_c0_g3~~TRINITY_DN2643_c0_g3_i1.p1  ORF type:complete len:283 (-),score=61.91 TRINITY_DN2643_c0_g3_i1:382-1230(-)